MRPSAPSGGAAEITSANALVSARRHAQDAEHEPRAERAARSWMACAVSAKQAASSEDAAGWAASEALANRCTGKLLDFLLAYEPQRWTPGALNIAGASLQVVFSGMPTSLEGAFALERASAITIPSVMGPRYATEGFGIALVAMQPRCTDRPICTLFPPEGVARSVTAWVDSGADGNPRLVMIDPLAHPQVTLGSRRVPLSNDFTASYAALFEKSRLNRLAIWNLVGGKQIGHRQGLYLLEDYDPDKTPIIMLHGLGGSPLVWARLTNRVFGSPELRARYQVWHVVYQTNSPVLLNRLRVQHFLDRGWSVLDPQGTSLARREVVLIGHSMGGVVSRLLTSDSREVVWKAAFDEPASALVAAPDDIALVDSIFHFKPYPGVSRAIFLASPHMGSPLADHFWGRLARRLVDAHSSELDALVRVVDANRAHVSPILLDSYRTDGLSSVNTLGLRQPVSLASHALMPVPGVRYDTIAGSLPGEDPPGDGVVPLSSAILAGAASTTIVSSGHRLYRNDEALTRVLEILREPEAPVSTR